MKGGYTRRDTLRVGLATGVLTLTGCLSGDQDGTDGRTDNTEGEAGETGDESSTGGPSDGGNRTAADDTNTPPAEQFDPPAYTRWLYAPGTVQDERHSFFNYTDHSAIRAVRDDLDEGVYDQIATFADQFPFEQMGLDYADIDTTLFHNVVRVTTGTFERNRVVTALEDAGFEQVSTRGGYTVLSGADSVTAQGALAVDTGRAVSAMPFGRSDGPTPRTAVTAALDADQGTGDRYVETSTAMARLTAALGTGANLSVSTQEPADRTDIGAGTFEGLIADGSRARLDGPRTTVRLIQLFADSEEVPVDDIREWTRTSPQFDSIGEISVSASGREVAVTGEAETNVFLSG